MTTTTATERVGGGETRSRELVQGAAWLGALACVGFLAGFAILSGYSFREGYLTAYSLANNALTFIAFSLLALSIPGLGRNVDLPRWALTTSAAACAAVAAMAWVLMTETPHFARLVTDHEFDAFSTYLILFPLPKMILGLVGFGALGVAGLRRRSIPRGAAVLFILGAVLSLWWAYPPGGLLAALGFVWVARFASEDR